MALTRAWSEAVGVASKLTKGLNIASIDETICDMVSSEVWAEKPWFQSIQNIGTGTLLLVDGQQDYSAPNNILRLMNARITRTDTTPEQDITLDIQEALEVDAIARSPFGIRCISHEAEAGGLRLESAVQVASGTSWEIRGSYQIHPIKVASLGLGLWFHDEHFMVAVEGILYWMYRLADDSRAGTAMADPVTRRVSYSGQLAVFHSRIDQMWATEELQGTENWSPEISIGAGVNHFDGRGIFG